MIRRALSYLTCEIREALGEAPRIEKLLSAYPEASDFRCPPPSVGAGDVVRWNELGDYSYRFNMREGHMRGRRKVGGRVEAASIVNHALMNLGTVNEIESATFDINDIHGIFAAKNGPSTEFGLFRSLDDWIAKSSPELVQPITERKLEENLSHRGINILHKRGDHLVYFKWHQKAYLANTDGGHHFAAARYIARRLGRRVPVTGKLYSYGIDTSAAVALNNEFAIFAVPDGNIDLIHDLYKETYKSQVTWYWRPFPRPLQNRQRLIFLPRAVAKSRRVADIFLARRFVDIGAFLVSAGKRSEMCRA